MDRVIFQAIGSIAKDTANPPSVPIQPTIHTEMPKTATRVTWSSGRHENNDTNEHEGR